MALNLKEARVLIIDDFEGMLRMLREFIRVAGAAQIDTAKNGKDAVAALSKNKYDVVLCDYNLGEGKNGQQILEEAKVRELIGFTTVWIMITAEKTMDMVMGAAEYEPDDYLLKPINEELLKGRLERLLAKKWALQDVEKAVKRKDYTKAVAKCDELMKQDPTMAQDMLRLKARFLLIKGDYAAARALFESLLSVRSVNWAKTGLGKVYFLSGEYLKAKDILSEVLEDNSSSLETYDWLVKTYQALGDHEQARELISQALTLSPNSGQRQKILGDLANATGDKAGAEAAYRKAIKLSEHSILKTTEPFTGLAKLCTEKGKADEALKLMEDVRKVFTDPVSAMQASVVESGAFQKLGKPDKAQAALAEAERQLKGLGAKAGVQDNLALANAMLALGDKEKAMGLITQVVKNNHDNNGVLNQVDKFFKDADLHEEGKTLVQTSKDEVININNQGVRLAQEGKLDEAIELLRQAVSQLPNNARIRLNLAGMLLKHLQEVGKDDTLLYEVRKELDRANALQPGDPKCMEYMQAVEKIAAS
ncbi:MAG: tetratricopeptide repeat protein [Hydrogenophilales bacterium]|nr:tetratricopeptide repeat protein [Hydrogenophilales bacterium]